jgi:cytoskeletal protein RodZ
MTIGEYLKRIREEKKITLEQVAEGTNIRIKYLQAIEDDRLDLLPSLSQARGFSRLYAVFLGLNAQQVFDEVERANQPPVAEPEPEAAIEEIIPEPVQVEKTEPFAKKVFSKISRKSRKQKQEQTKISVTAAKPHSQIVFEEIGKELQKQREALGLSRADVERQIKIREYFIYSLEHGQIDNLPSTVQGRGMLNNYASFMNLDAESLQIRYAEGLQQRRQERHEAEEEAKKTGITVVGKEPLTGWRKLLTPDLLIGGSVFIVLFGLIVWGAIQVIRTSLPAAEPTIGAVSEEATGVSTPSPTMMQETSGTPAVGVQAGTTQAMTTPLVNLQLTLTSSNTNPIQLVIVAYQRAYMKITVDGKEEFTGRVVPGNVYSYSGKTKITLLTGNGAALQVYYNQVDQGVLGFLGEVVEMEYTSREAVTPTPRFTATPTLTQQPTLTARPTETPLPSPTFPTATITPARTISQ